MINHFKATPDARAHWEITDPTMVKIETTLFENRNKLFVQTFGPRKTSRTFPQGDPVVLILPTGKWLVESSDDALKWFTVTTLTSDNGSQRINILVDGTPDTIRYGRYTKI